MRISKAYWIWGLFPPEETNLLNKIKVKVQSKLRSPAFDTHITLAGPYLDIDKKFILKLKTFVENNSRITIDVKGYNFKKQIYNSFYLSINNSKELKYLRKNIYELKKFDLQNNYSPHISLSYGNHRIKEKIELIPKLPKFFNSIEISQVALVEVDENINLWKILENFYFNNKI